MKILHTVEFYSPSFGGMQEVVKQISENLVKRGHDVTVATSKIQSRNFNKLNGVKIKEFDIKGNYVRGIDGDIGAYVEFVEKGGFDVMTNFAAQQWATDALLPVLPKIKPAKVFVPTGFSGFYDPLYKEYFRNLEGWMKNYDMNIFLSEDYRDINFARKSKISDKKIKVIPNGASEKEFKKKYKYDFRKEFGISENNFLVITVGSHTGLKGHREAIEVFRRAKIKNATLAIIGNSFGGGCTYFCKAIGWLSKNRLLPGNKIIVPNLTREETVVAYQQADLFLFPSNIECSPIVLFEAGASKTPFLSSDVGNAEEIAKWTRGGKILPTRKDKSGFSHIEIDKSAQLLKSLVEDKSLLSKMAKNGYKSWKDRFTWGKISRKYENIYKKLLSK